MFPGLKKNWYNDEFYLEFNSRSDFTTLHSLYFLLLKMLIIWLGWKSILGLSCFILWGVVSSADVTAAQKLKKFRRKLFFQSRNFEILTFFNTLQRFNNKMSFELKSKLSLENSLIIRYCLDHIWTKSLSSVELKHPYFDEPFVCLSPGNEVLSSYPSFLSVPLPEKVVIVILIFNRLIFPITVT